MKSKLLTSLCAMASGALAVLAFSPFGYWPLVILSLLGLYALLDKANPKQAAWRGFGYAMGLFLPGQWWIHVSMTEFGGIPLPAAFVLLAGLCAYLSLYPTLACWAFARFFGGRHWSRWLLAFPALWLMADWLRGAGLLVILDHGTRAIPVLGAPQAWPPSEPWSPFSSEPLQITQSRLIYRMPTNNPEYQLVLISPRTAMHLPTLWWWPKAERCT